MLQTSAERYSCECFSSLLSTLAFESGVNEIPWQHLLCRAFIAANRIGDRVLAWSIIEICRNLREKTMYVEYSCSCRPNTVLDGMTRDHPFQTPFSYNTLFAAVT
jgi:hypothetical protein